MKDEPAIVKTLRKEERTRLNSGASPEYIPFFDIGAPDAQPTPTMENALFQKLDFLPIQTPLTDQNDSNLLAMLTPNLEDSDTNALYRALIENSTEGILIIDFKGNIIYSNTTLSKMFGFENPQETIGENIADYVDEDFKSKLLKGQLLSRFSGKRYVDTYECKKRDTTPFWVEIQGTLLHFNNQKTPVMYVRDITDSITTKDQLKNTTQNFTDLYENAPIPYHTITAEGIIININQQWLKTLGYKRHEVVGKNIFDLLPGYTDRAIELLNHSDHQHHYTDGSEIKLTTKNGTKKTFVVTHFLQNDFEDNTILVHTTLQDITQLKQAWQELNSRETQYRILTEALIDGVFTIDNLGVITYANPALCHILGKTNQQLIGQPLRDFIKNDYIYLYQQKLLELRSTQTPVRNLQVHFRQPHGELLPAELSLSIMHKDDDTIGIEGIVRDITSQLQIQKELVKNEQLRKEFMNIAAHELKSPVTPIKGYLDLIRKDETATDRMRNWANIAYRNSERLLRLIGDILDVSRLDSGTMSFDMKRINTEALLHHTIEDMTPTIEGKGLLFNIELPKTLPDIIADEYRLAQVMKNLLTNAIKFTDEGFIGITVKNNTDQHTLTITVTDTGIGIPQSEHEKIFEKFHQSYTAADRRHEGTGLGLFISKEIVTKHKGTIRVESQLEKGSRFIITLPTLDM